MKTPYRQRLAAAYAAANPSAGQKLLIKQHEAKSDRKVLEHANAGNSSVRSQPEWPGSGFNSSRVFPI